MSTVAMLYICTGAYNVFWKDFYPNFEQYFLPGHDKTYFVFTDADAIAHEEQPNVRRIPWQARPWPYSTMARFDAFLSQEEALKTFDWLIFANANLLCQQTVPADMVLPDPTAGQELFVVYDLPYRGRDPIFLPYERRPRSRAAIPYNCGQNYVEGGLNGGTSAAFLALSRELKARMDADLADGIIACHHDESHLNRLVAEQPQRFRFDRPELSVPEETPLPSGQEYIRVLQKSRFIDVGAIKGTSPRQNFIQRKWEAFCLNWLPYLWWLRDTLLRKTI